MVSNFVWGVLLVLLFSTVCSRSALVRPREVDVRAGEPRNTVQAFQRYIRLVYQPQAEDVIYNDQEASWAYNINITGYNEELMIAASEETALFDQETAQYVRSSFSNIDFSSNMTLERLYDKLVLLGDANLNSTDFSELQEVQTRMQRIYNTAKICRNPSIHADDVLSKCPKDQQLSLEPDVSQILATSRNETLLRHVWKSWRDATGKKMHGDYQRYVELKNKASSMDGYADTGAAWRSTYVDTYTNYTDQMFLDEAEAIWQQLKPLYEQLHAYIRHKLKEQYPTVKALSNTNSPIPAHLLGNMWAQTWGNLQEFTRPHPEKQSLDVTEAMVEQNYTADTMFRKSDDFFATLGLIRMPQKFWDKSMIERPADNSTKVVCHASAWDFYNRQDFRIKQCTEVTMEDFLTVHHEMGHVEYYLQYKDLEVPFRRGANDGFHEAVGDTLALSVQTPAHLKSLGLLMADFDINDPDLERNSLYSTALDKIAFLPFGYLMDKYRYDIFSGKIKPEQYNSKWWEHLVEYQGICSPVKRSDSDFDPGSKYHIPAGVPYMRYFVSFILQFQFHKAMCQEAGYTGPLHRCDVSAPELGDGGKRAGALLAKTLKMGSSQPWTQAISAITNGNSSRMDAGPLLEFFTPMQQWLTQKNAELGITPGWSKEPECSEETAFQAWLNLHNNESSVVKSAEMFATWAYQTNITKANELAMLEASNVAAAFAKRKTEEMLGLFPNPDEITDPLLRRAYEKLSKLGDAALSPEDFARLGAIRTEMEQVYSVAKVCNDTSIGIDMERCPQHQQMALSPEITDILHSSRDPEELLYYWSAWRDATGKKMRSNFTEYVGLKNKAAVADGYKDNAEAWRAPYVEPSYNYTDADFLEDADRLWNQMKPLYQQLHAYIRYKLWELYGNKTVPSLNGPIPAHLLSNQWAQTWVGLLDFTEPFPGKPQLDVTQEMQKQGWTARRMFNVSEEFFTDLGLIGMPEEFWKISMIEKPSDREVVCHASAEDFYDGIHFGIKQCTAVTMSDLLTVHQ
ncbi:hypothetical protein RvY_00195-2 [Ramazzottius varieornatus]|uniref:Angiotensin-converting enzyme n=1 Tax=Ramazzottius varieornatus TaxID=947166 RepID=A0A1D1UCV4_RAMVA|nr:hypothetical protein RvY_00195-2 [Ramazzottius varieornatus]